MRDAYAAPLHHDSADDALPTIPEAIIVLVGDGRKRKQAMKDSLLAQQTELEQENTEMRQLLCLKERQLVELRHHLQVAESSAGKPLGSLSSQDDDVLMLPSPPNSVNAHGLF